MSCVVLSLTSTKNLCTPMPSKMVSYLFCSENSCTTSSLSSYCSLKLYSYSICSIGKFTERINFSPLLITPSLSLPYKTLACANTPKTLCVHKIIINMNAIPVRFANLIFFILILPFYPTDKLPHPK